MTKKGMKGDDAISSSLDRLAVESALACGLYESEEALNRDIFGGKEPDDFTKLAAKHTLADQVKAKCYGDLLDMKGIRTITVSFKRHGEATNVRGVIVINGPGKNGYLILENRKSAMFTIKMRGDMWTKFVGAGDSHRHTTANVLAFSIGSPLRVVHEAVEKMVRSCNDDSWLHVHSFPVDVSRITDSFVADLLVQTPFGVHPEEVINDFP